MTIIIPSLADKAIRALAFIGNVNYCKVETSHHPGYSMVQWVKGDNDEASFIIYRSLGMKEWQSIIMRANRLVDVLFGENNKDW